MFFSQKKQRGSRMRPIINKTVVLFLMGALLPVCTYGTEEQDLSYLKSLGENYNVSEIPIVALDSLFQLESLDSSHSQENRVTNKDSSSLPNRTIIEEKSPLPSHSQNHPENFSKKSEEGLDDWAPLDTFKFGFTEKKEHLPSKSHTAIHILYEYLLYQYEDPNAYQKLIYEAESKKIELVKNATTEEEKTAIIREKEAEIASLKRSKEESTKNQAYFYQCQKTNTQRAFSLQPTALKNELRKADEEWLARRDDEYVQYDKALTELAKRKNTHQIDPSAVNAMKLKKAQRVFDVTLNNYVKKHGPKDVQLGDREASKEEILAIKKKIHVAIDQKTKGTGVKIITSPTSTFYYPIGTPYFKESNTAKTQGFTLGAEDPPCLYESAEKFVVLYEKENTILDAFYVLYQEEFFTDFKSWNFWKSWEEKIQNFQNTAKRTIEHKYPLPPSPGKWSRDLATEEGKILAAMGKDERGLKVGKFILKVKPLSYDKSYEEVNEDDLFSKFYEGADDPEVIPQKYQGNIKTKCSFLLPATVNITKIKTRKYTLDEERYSLLFLLSEPTQEELDLLGPEELAIYLKDKELYCKAKDQDAVKIDANTLNKDLQKFMKEKRDPNPQERQALLDLMFKKGYVKRIEQDFMTPKGIQMLDSYVALPYVRSHKAVWNEVMKELLNKKPSLNHLVLQNSYLKQNNQFCEKLKGAVEANVKNFNDMSPYAAYTKIPPCWQLFFLQTPLEISLLDPPTEIALSKKFLHDEDLQKKRVIKHSCFLKNTNSEYAHEYEYKREYMLYCYMNVDLSKNYLTGTTNYYFHEFITILNLSHSQIQSLNFLSGLKALKNLNLSHNLLSDLSGFLNFSDSSNQGCLLLQELNLSHNEITDVNPLSVLRALNKLNLSTNKIKTLAGFHERQSISLQNIEKDQMEKEVQQMVQNNVKTSLLIYLDVENNELEGPLEQVFSKGLKNLQTLKIKNNPSLILSEKSEYNPSAFFSHFPSLKTLSTDKGDENNMSRTPVEIDLKQGTISDVYIKITDEGTVLKISENVKEDHKLFYYTHLNLSHNTLRGSGIESYNFCSNRITKLDISFNELYELTFLNDLLSLTYLNVSHNRIGIIPSSLKCVASLIYLDISANKIESLQPLGDFVLLRTLKATDNPLKGVSQWAFLKNLEFEYNSSTSSNKQNNEVEVSPFDLQTEQKSKEGK